MSVVNNEAKAIIDITDDDVLEAAIQELSQILKDRRSAKSNTIIKKFDEAIQFAHDCGYTVLHYNEDGDEVEIKVGDFKYYLTYPNEILLF